MNPFHYASCSAVVAAIRAPGWQHEHAGRLLAALLPGSRISRSSLNQYCNDVPSVADIESDAHTEVHIVKPFLDANEATSAGKVADISD